MEELVLTDPIVKPEEVTSKYKVITLTMTIGEVLPGSEGYLHIELKDNLGKQFMYAYTGQEALDYIKFINTANFTTNSLHKRILQKLSNDGVLPGTVVGVPDPA